MLSAFSDAKQTRSFTDSHINVLACDKKRTLHRKTAHFKCSIVSRGLGRAIETARWEWAKTTMKHWIHENYVPFFLRLKLETLNLFIYFAMNVVWVAFWIDCWLNQSLYHFGGYLKWMFRLLPILFHQNIFNETRQIEEIQKCWEKVSILVMIDGHNLHWRKNSEISSWIEYIQLNSI